jgi:xanthine dehydrogenase accessory factor
MAKLVMVRGGGDLASGAILRLARAGISVIVTELKEPLAVRRSVSFSRAVYDREVMVEEVPVKLVGSPGEARNLVARKIIPVLIDPKAESRQELHPVVIVDGRMTKQIPDLPADCAQLFIGLGPGFVAGENCHAVVETRRGPTLGRVIWSGAAEKDTGLPDTVYNFQAERVLRAPADGHLETFFKIGEHIDAGGVIAQVDGIPLRAPFSGVLRGLLRPGAVVWLGMKIGDMDPRDIPELVDFVSDKALAVGGGVLEAVLTKPEIRSQLW